RPTRKRMGRPHHQNPGLTAPSSRGYDRRRNALSPSADRSGHGGRFSTAKHPNTAANNPVTLPTNNTRSTSTAGVHVAFPSCTTNTPTGRDPHRPVHATGTTSAPSGPETGSP